MAFSLFRLCRPLILASASPRRRDFLYSAGLRAEVHPAACPEPRPEAGEDPLAYTRRCAQAKALAVASELAGRRDHPAVLAADTAVILRDGAKAEILGKPANRDDAVAMLEKLCGRTHQVTTACCLAWDGQADVFDDTADVTFNDWPRSALEAYAAGGEPMDKAGAYGIQGGGAFLVREMRGSWSTVVGLPLDMVLKRMLQAGILQNVR